jgi:hypothetical protein
MNYIKPQNILVCSFDVTSPRTSAYWIHEWLYDVMHLPEADVRTLQIDGTQCKVFIKFINYDKMTTMYNRIDGPLEYKHEDGTLSLVQVEMAGIGHKKVRVANLPPEAPNGALYDVLKKYGSIKQISEERWPAKYRYHNESGMKVVEMTLSNHIPSHMTVMGVRLLISYEGQPMTCYECSAPGHQYSECPLRKSNVMGGK